MIDWENVGKQPASEATFVEPTPEPEPQEQRLTIVLPDIAAVKADLADGVARLNNAVQVAKEFEITDDASNQQAPDLIAGLKRFEKAIEKRRKELVDEPFRFKKAVDGFCKSLTDLIAQGVKAVTTQQQQYFRKQEAERLRREAEERAAREKLEREMEEDRRRKQAELDAEREAKLKEEAERAAAENREPDEIPRVEVEKTELPEVVPEETPKVARGETGAATHFRAEWVFEILNIDKVPVDYLRRALRKTPLPLEQIVRADIKGGIREIPGVRIWEEKKPVTRI